MSRGRSGVNIEFAMNTGSFFNEATVELDKPHRNNFAAILGMPTWDVGVTATARATFQANGARGAMPLHVQRRGIPRSGLQRRGRTCTPTGLPAARLAATRTCRRTPRQFNWTIFCTASGNPCNANSNDGRRDLIHGHGANTVVYLDDDIGPLNAGTHNTLFDDLDGERDGHHVPRPDRRRRRP